MAVTRRSTAGKRLGSKFVYNNIMPKYDYICQTCGRPSSHIFSYAEYDNAQPLCPHCRSDQLKRRIGRVAVAKSDGSRVDGLMDDPNLAGFDDDDPKSIGRFMRNMSSELGEDMGDEFNEVVDRLEKGEAPEKIEKEMPSLTNNDSIVE